MTSKFVLKGMLPLCASFALLAACGDDDSSSVYGGSATKKESVEKFKYLDECTKSLDGDTVYVEADEADYVCDDGEWVKVSDEDESSSSKGGKSSSSSKGDKSSSSDKDDKSSSSDKDSSSSKDESSSSKGDGSSDSKDVSSSSLSDVEKALGVCDSATADSIGKIEKKTYFCKDGKWRVVGGMEEVIGVCRKAIYDSIATTAGKTYICEESGWVNITELDAKLGKCTKAIADSMVINENHYYRCNVDESKAQWIKIELPEYEIGKCNEALLDTVVELMEWGEHLKYFACGKEDKKYSWIELNGIDQADTYNWPDGKDGDSRWGDFDKSTCYVYDSEYGEAYGQAWTRHKNDDLSCKKGMTGCTFMRTDTLVKDSVSENWYKCVSASLIPRWNSAEDMEVVRGVCRESIADSVALYNGDYYICRHEGTYSGYKWKRATMFEYDTYRWKNGREGDTARGNVSKELYYYGQNGWTYMTRWSWDVPLDYRFKEGVPYGTLKDSRDGKEYKTVTIGEQTWMAENLNYDVPGKSWCHNDSSKYCGVSGRYYTWAAAVDSTALANDKSNPQTCGVGSGVDDCDLTDKEIGGVCPEGWHLPSMNEWSKLYVAVDGHVDEVKSQTGWKSETNENGSNASGFTALPVGVNYYDSVLKTATTFATGCVAYWTSSICKDCSEDDYSYAMDILCWGSMTLAAKERKFALPVRCVKD